MTGIRFPNLTVLEHPLIQHKLAILRDKATPVKDFKQLVRARAQATRQSYTAARAEMRPPVEVGVESGQFSQRFGALGRAVNASLL